MISWFAVKMSLDEASDDMLASALQRTLVLIWLQKNRLPGMKILETPNQRLA